MHFEWKNVVFFFLFRPYCRGGDGTLKTFEDELIDKLAAVRPQQMAQSNEAYNTLWNDTEKLREGDIESPWGFRSDQVFRQQELRRLHQQQHVC